MGTERTPNDGSNIPHEGISVQQLIASAVSAHPVRLCRVGLEVRAGSTEDEVFALCRSLFTLSARVNIFVYLSLGDALRYFPAYSAARKAFVARVELEMGKNFATRLKDFAKIAHRWPHSRRHEKLTWTYCRSHKPGRPGEPDIPVTKREIEPEYISTTIDGNVEEIRGTLRGQVYVIRRWVKP